MKHNCCDAQWQFAPSCSNEGQTLLILALHLWLASGSRLGFRFENGANPQGRDVPHLPRGDSQGQQAGGPCAESPVQRITASICKHALFARRIESNGINDVRLSPVEGFPVTSCIPKTCAYIPICQPQLSPVTPDSVAETLASCNESLSFFFALMSLIDSVPAAQLPNRMPSPDPFEAGLAEADLDALLDQCVSQLQSSWVDAAGSDVTDVEGCPFCPRCGYGTIAEQVRSPCRKLLPIHNLPQDCLL